MFWFTLLLWAGTFVASQLLTPEPEIENAKAATLDDFNFPTATEGRVIPLVWGTDKLKGSNVIWYGDLRTVPIREKVKVSLFNSKTFTKGYRYYVGIQFGLALGECTLTKIWVGDDLVWSGSQSTYGDITLSHEFAKGTFSFYPGSKTQPVDSYLSSHQSPCPAYRGLCYGVFKGGYVGESTSIKPWAFELQRIPNGLSLGTPGVNSGKDANLMNVAYEIMTNSDWGYGYPASDIDTTQLAADAATLLSEGNGYTTIVSSSTQVTDILEELEKQGDIRFRLDPATGKFTSSLIRDDYVVEDLKVANNDNILELIEFSRGSWEGTINNVRVQFKRRANDYSEGYAPAQDMANMQVQGRKVSATYAFTGVRDDDLANSLAWREIRSNSYPLAKARIRVNRTFWDSYVGEPILVDYTCSEIEIDNLPMRITKTEIGDQKDAQIILDLVQDVFSYKVPSFAAPDASSWTIPDRTLAPFESDEQIAFEAPYAIAIRDDAYSENRIWCGGVSPGRGESGAYIKQRNHSSTPSGDYYDAGVTGFIFAGTLVSDIAPDTTTIEVYTDMDETEVLSVQTYDVGNNLANLMLIDDEFVACQSASAITGGLELANSHRGMLDSAQVAHAAGAPVYFLFTGGTLTDTAFTDGYVVDIKMLPYRDGDQSVVNIGDASAIQIDTDYRERKPYPPTKLELNGTVYPTGTVSLDTDFLSGGTEDDRGVYVEFNRRDWRIYDELSQYATDAEDINADFPTNNTTQYNLKVYNDPDGANTLLFTIAYATITKTGGIMATLAKILRYMTGAAVPSRLRFSVGTQHTDEYSTVREADQRLYYDVDVDSSELDGDHSFGVMSTVDTYGTQWASAPDTGTYAFILGTSGPSVWASVNGGAEQEIISAGNTSGNLTSVTAGDTIDVKYKGTVTGDETLIRVNSPTSAVDAYGVFV